AMYAPGRRRAGGLLAALRARYGALVTEPVRVNVRLSEAPTLGRTIYEYDPRSRGAADYALLVERVSDLFGFRPTARPVAQAPSASHATVTAPQPEPPQPAARLPTPQLPPTNGAFGAPPGCPNCGHPLQHA